MTDIRTAKKVKSNKGAGKVDGIRQGTKDHVQAISESINRYMIKSILDSFQKDEIMLYII